MEERVRTPSLFFMPLSFPSLPHPAKKTKKTKKRYDYLESHFPEMSYLEFCRIVDMTSEVGISRESRGLDENYLEKDGIGLASPLDENKKMSKSKKSERKSSKKRSKLKKKKEKKKEKEKEKEEDDGSGSSDDDDDSPEGDKKKKHKKNKKKQKKIDGKDIHKLLERQRREELEKIEQFSRIVTWIEYFAVLLLLAGLLTIVAMGVKKRFKKE